MSKRIKRMWSEDEDNELRRLYHELAGTGRLGQIGPMVGRTADSVRSRAKRLGIVDVANKGAAKGELNHNWNGGLPARRERGRLNKEQERRARGAYKRIPWTEADDSRLAELCMQMSVREVAEALGRTVGSTNRRIGFLNIPHRSRNWQRPGAGHHNWKGGKPASGRRKTWRLEPSEFDRMIASQDGRCAICLRTRAEIASIRGFHVDHDHATGTIRGLLCHHCNLMLGNASDSVTLLRLAIDYLESHGTCDVYGRQFEIGA